MYNTFFQGDDMSTLLFAPPWQSVHPHIGRFLNGVAYNWCFYSFRSSPFLFDSRFRPCAGWAPSCADSSSWTAGPKRSTYTRRTRPAMRCTSSRTSCAWDRSTAGRFIRAVRTAKSTSGLIIIYTTSSPPGNRTYPRKIRIEITHHKRGPRTKIWEEVIFQFLFIANTSDHVRRRAICKRILNIENNLIFPWNISVDV